MLSDDNLTDKIDLLNLIFKIMIKIKGYEMMKCVQNVISMKYFVFQVMI